MRRVTIERAMYDRVERARNVAGRFHRLDTRR